MLCQAPWEQARRQGYRRGGGAGGGLLGKRGFTLAVQMGPEGRVRGQVLITVIVAKPQKCLGFHNTFSHISPRIVPTSLQTHCTDEEAE